MHHYTWPALFKSRLCPTRSQEWTVTRRRTETLCAARTASRCTPRSSTSPTTPTPKVSKCRKEVVPSGQKKWSQNFPRRREEGRTDDAEARGQKGAWREKGTQGKWDKGGIAVRAEKETCLTKLTWEELIRVSEWGCCEVDASIEALKHVHALDRGYGMILWFNSGIEIEHKITQPVFHYCQNLYAQPLSTAWTCFTENLLAISGISEAKIWRTTYFWCN